MLTCLWFSKYLACSPFELLGAKRKLTCFHASFFPFCPFCWPPLFLPFSRHLFAIFFPSKSALFCREKGTVQSLERGSSGMHLSTKFGKEIPSRNLREKRSGKRGFFFTRCLVLGRRSCQTHYQSLNTRGGKRWGCQNTYANVGGISKLLWRHAFVGPYPSPVEHRLWKIITIRTKIYADWLGVVFPTFRLSINSCVSDRVKLIETD